MPFLPLTGDRVLSLPPVDDGSYPVTLPEPLPLGTAPNLTTYTTAYVSLLNWTLIIIIYIRLAVMVSLVLEVDLLNTLLKGSHIVHIHSLPHTGLTLI